MLASLGIKKLKEQQREAIHSFIRGRDVFVALPTSYGKSLIYGCLPRVFDLLRGVQEPKSIIMVISPLKALMDDKCSAFTKLGLIAACVGDDSVSWESFLLGKIQIVIITPESLIKGKQWRDILKSQEYYTEAVFNCVMFKSTFSYYCIWSRR